MAQIEPPKNSNQVVVELTMPLGEARNFIWQGARAPREPMGKLLDSKQLDSSDLAWATDCGYDPKFREAARTLLANWLGQPTTREKISRYGPEVIEGSHFLENKEIENLVYAACYLGVAVTGAAGLLVSAISDLLQGKYSTAPILAAFVLLFGGLLILYIFRLFRNRFNKAKYFRAGREGEDEIVDRLRTALDNRWTIFRNLHLPGHNDDLDIVLVGPGGVWVVEAKSSKSTIRIEGKNWSMQTSKGWVPTRNSPSIDVTKNALRLNDFLKRQGINRWIEKAIALASPQPVTNFDLSEIPVWLLPTIEEKVGSLSTRYPPTEAETKQIVGIFKELATKQIAKEDAQYNK